jgi:hypothetical protein
MPLRHKNNTLSTKNLDRLTKVDLPGKVDPSFLLLTKSSHSISTIIVKENLLSLLLKAYIPPVIHKLIPNSYELLARL